MIVWVKKEVVGFPCNQRAELLETCGGNLRVRLCGTDEIVLIAPDETCGIEFSDTVSIAFQATGTLRKRVHR